MTKQRCLKVFINTTIAIVIIISNILLSNQIYSYIEHKNYIINNELKYGYVINNPIDNCFVYFGNTIEFKLKNSNEQIYAEVIMNMDNKEYELENDEIIISKNIANKYHLLTGDIIVAKDLINLSFKNYHIKQIVNLGYGINNIDIAGNKGVIIFGKEQSYINNLIVQYISLSNKDLSKQISDSGMQLIDLIDFSEQVELCNSEIYKAVFFVFLLVLVSCLIVFSISFTQYLPRLKYKVLKGQKYNKVAKDLLLFILNSNAHIIGFALMSNLILYAIGIEKALLLVTTLITQVLVLICEYILLYLSLRRI